MHINAPGDFEEMDEEMAREFDDDVLNAEAAELKQSGKLTVSLAKYFTYTVASS